MRRPGAKARPRPGRCLPAPGPRSIFTYKGPATVTRHKEREEMEVLVDSPETMGTILERSGLREGEQFDLVLGSPPYFPPGTGIGDHTHPGLEHHLIVAGTWKMRQGDHVFELGCGVGEVDDEGFVRYFDEASAYFGTLKDEAMESTNRMVTQMARERR